MKTPTKLNLGAGFDWQPIEGWAKLDHNRGMLGARQAWNTGYADQSFDTVFSSHMFEHISHFKIEEVICEINRILKPGGVLRLLTPNLKKIAAAYVNGDKAAMSLYIQEDGSGIRQDLGLGQAFMSFLVSPGFDNFLCDSNLGRPLAGYAHLYSYDYEMLSGLLAHYGFHQISEPSVDDSRIAEHRQLRNVPHDTDRNHSLVIECIKEKDAHFDPAGALLHAGPYRIAEIGMKQQLITRQVMKVTSVLDSLLYKSVKNLVALINPRLVNRPQLPFRSRSAEST